MSVVPLLPTSGPLSDSEVEWLSGMIEASAEPLARAQLLRSIISAGPGTGIQVGKTIINISASKDISISNAGIDSIKLAAFHAAIDDLRNSVATNRLERSLQDYFGAMREFGHGLGYGLGYIFTERDTSKDHSLAEVYVPLSTVSINAREAHHSTSRDFTDVGEAFRARPESGPLRVILEGAPGSGKSTILRQLMRYSWDDPDKLQLPCKFLPIYVRLASLAESIGGSLEERIWNAISADKLLTLTSPPPNGWFTDWPGVAGTQLLLLLDGFDEASPERQVELRGWIDRLIRQEYSVVLTTRATSSVGIVLADRFHCYRLTPFNSTQQKLLAENWLGTRSGPFLAELQRTQSYIIQATPLLLTIAALVYDSDSRLPEGRIGLYKRFISTWLDESSRRGLHDELGEVAEYARESLQFLAFCMTENPSGITEGALLPRLKDFYKVSLSLSSLQAARWARQFLQVSTRKSVVFTSAGGAYSWIHPTFREYLAAEMIANSEVLATSISNYIQRWRDEPWQGVVLFLLGISALSSDPSQYLWEIASERTLEALLFAGTVLSEGIAVDSDLLQAILSGLSSLVLETIQQNEKEDKRHGSPQLRLTSQTALRLLSNFGSGLGLTQYIKALGNYVASLATGRDTEATDEVRILRELGCYDDLLLLMQNRSAPLTTRVEAAIALLGSSLTAQALTHISDLTSESCNARTDLFLERANSHMGTDQIAALVTLTGTCQRAQIKCVDLLSRRGGDYLLLELESNLTLPLIVRAHAALRLDRSTADYNHFKILIDSVTTDEIEWKALLAWLTEDRLLLQLSIVAESSNALLESRIEAIEILSRIGSVDRMVSIFHKCVEIDIKLRAASQVFKLTDDETITGELRYWYTTELMACDDLALLVDGASDLHNNGFYEDAIKVYTQILSQNPTDAISLANRGNAYRLIERWQQAIDDFTHTIELEPKAVWARIRRGHCLWRIDREGAAVADFDLASELLPSHKVFCLSYGDSCRVVGRHLDAIGHLNDYIEHDPSDWRGYYYRGLAFQEVGYPDRAAKDLEHANSLNPESISCRIQLSKSYSILGRKDEMYSILLPVVSSGRENQSLMARLTIVLLCMDRVPEANDVGTLLRDKHPSESVYGYLHALCAFLTSGDQSEFGRALLAVSEIAACELAQCEQESYMRLASNYLLYRLAYGDVIEARSAFSKLLEKTNSLPYLRSRTLNGVLELMQMLPRRSDIRKFFRGMQSKLRPDKAFVACSQPFPIRTADDTSSTIDTVIPRSEGPYPFPCYCQMRSIEGLHLIQFFAESMLERFNSSIPAIAVVSLDGSDRIFGLCNFKKEISDEYDFKFCDLYETFVDRDLELFARGYGAFCLLTSEDELFNRLQVAGVDVTFGISLKRAEMD